MANFLRYVLLLLLSLTGILLLIFIALNFRDEDLSPRLKSDLLLPPKSVSESARSGFKYFLGFGAVEGSDPARKGAEQYEALRTRGPISGLDEPRWSITLGAECRYVTGLLAKEKFDQVRPELEECLRSNTLAINRFDELMGFGQMASDLPPRIHSLPYSQLMAAHKLKMIQLNLWARENNFDPLVTDSVKMNTFFVNTLKHPSSFLQGLLALALLKSLRDFLGEVAQDNPAFGHALSGETRRALLVHLSYQALAEGIRSHETRVLHHMFANKIRSEMLDFTFIEADKLRTIDKARHWITNRFMPFLLKPNKTLNAYDRALRTAILGEGEIRPEGRRRWTVINPLGQKLIDQLSADFVSRFARLRSQIEELGRPLSF